MRHYEIADLNLRIARARLLCQIAREPERLADLLAFAGTLGDSTVADSLAAFRAAQKDIQRTAQAQIARLIRPDAKQSC